MICFLNNIQATKRYPDQLFTLILAAITCSCKVKDGLRVSMAIKLFDLPGLRWLVHMLMLQQSFAGLRNVIVSS
jgi:hypothetical protein